MSPKEDLTRELLALWMNRTFAGPSERFDHEQRFMAWIQGRAPQVKEEPDGVL